MYIKSLKVVAALISSCVLSSAVMAQTTCISDSRIINSGGDGVEATALFIDDGPAANSCGSDSTASIVDAAGNIAVTVISVATDSSCSVTVIERGRTVSSNSQPVSNGNCFVENRGTQVEIDGSVFSVSGFAERRI